MLPRVALALLLLPLATGAAAEVSVQARGQRVDLSVTAAPLAEVLDRLGRQLGMKVVYEGPAPRQLVTVTLKDRTPAEAVLTLLEGLGVNYALLADETGAGVKTLLVAGAAPPTVAAAPSRPATQPAPLRRPFGPPMANGEPVDSFDPDQEETPDATMDNAGEGVGPPAGNDPAARPAQVLPGQQASQAPQQAPSAPPTPAQQYSVSPFTPQPPALPPPMGGVAGSAPAPAPTPKPQQ